MTQIYGRPWRSAGLGIVLHYSISCLFLAAALGGAIPAEAGPNDGPVRLARFDYIYGDVSWRADPNLSWAAATRNLPLRQGCQIWVPSGCRAELQFDDGSRLWLGDNALMTCQTLYSDSQGEFTELTLNDGAAECRLRHNRSLYQFNTPTVSCQAAGPARFRISTGDRTRIEVFNGSPIIEGPAGKTTLASGDYLDLQDPNLPYKILPLPPRDRFDTWCDERDAYWDRYTRRHAYRTLPRNIALASDDLDDYGTWRRDPRYGEVWHPHVSRGWRPYRAGHWVWVDPFGWTWVSDEPWGWAPYHYGTWAQFSFGWGWCPGPRYQPWCPAPVCFTDYGGYIGWCPISPAEIVYPATLSIGFGGGDWSLFFSIGSAGCYYPTSRFSFVADLWPSSYCNRFTYAPNNVFVNNTTIVRSFTVNNNTFITNPGFVPVNARAGATILADPASFGGRGNFRLASGQQSIAAFQRGRLVGAPTGGRLPVAGPQMARPTLASIAPNRQFRSSVPIARNALDRSVYRAPIQSHIAQTSAPLAHTLPANRSPRVLDRNTLRAAPVGGAAIAGATLAHRAAGQGAKPGMAARPSGPVPGGRERAGGAPTMGAGATAAERARQARANFGMRPGGGGNRQRTSGAAGPGNRQRVTNAIGGGQRAKMAGRPSGGTISSIQRRQQATHTQQNRAQLAKGASQQRQRAAARQQNARQQRISHAQNARRQQQNTAHAQRQSYRPRANAYRRQQQNTTRQQSHPSYAPRHSSGGGGSGGGHRSSGSAPRTYSRPERNYRSEFSPHRSPSINREPSMQSFQRSQPSSPRSSYRESSRPSGGGHMRAPSSSSHGGGGGAPHGGGGGGKRKGD